MAKGALTSYSVEHAKPGAARREIRDANCRGLYLVVQPAGAKSWAFRYRFNGKPKKLTIGPVYTGKDEPGRRPRPSLHLGGRPQACH